MNSAVISQCGLYRYRLDRDLSPTGTRGTLNVVMVNASTADAERNDPTVHRVVGYGRQWGFSRLIVTNMFGLRATDVRRLADHVDPVGRLNAEAILEAAHEADVVLVAWGSRAKLPREWRSQPDRTLKLLGAFDLYCLGRTKSGDPAHPLFLPSDLRPQLYRQKVKVDVSDRSE